MTALLLAVDEGPFSGSCSGVLLRCIDILISRQRPQSLEHFLGVREGEVINRIVYKLLQGTLLVSTTLLDDAAKVWGGRTGSSGVLNDGGSFELSSLASGDQNEVPEYSGVLWLIRSGTLFLLILLIFS